MSASSDGTSRRRWLIAVIGWGSVAGAALILGFLARQPEPLRSARGAGRALPRMPGPAPDFRTLLYLLGVGSVVWYAAAIATPLLAWGVRRVDAARVGRTRVAVLASGVVVGLMVLTAVLQYGITYHDAPLRPGVVDYLPQAIRQNVLPWLVVAGIVAAVEARRRAVQSALDHERLRAQVAEQRLIALTGQLHPHFLFNTLQGISTLIHRDPDAADEMLAKLSDLLRDLLRHREQVVVPLGDELRYARTYLEIARLRFAERLTFAISAAPDVERAAVPLFILQPLVENALAHGIGPQARGGTVTITATRADGRLRLTVEDDGAGISSSATPRTGIGLANTRERLRATFGDDHRFSLAPRPGGGTTVIVDLPLRAYAEPATA